MGCGGSHGPGGVLGLEARAELYISRVRPMGMRAGVSVQKALRSVLGDGGWPAWRLASGVHLPLGVQLVLPSPDPGVTAHLS